MTISDSLNIDINKSSHLKSAKKFIKNISEISFFNARAATLQSLLKKARALSLIDFLSLDAEGAELEILKGINFNNYRFKNFLGRHRYFLEDQFSPHDYLLKYF